MSAVYLFLFLVKQTALTTEVVVAMEVLLLLAVIFPLVADMVPTEIINTLVVFLERDLVAT